MPQRWIGVKVSVTRFVSDDAQPGIIEAELWDVHNRCWRFIEKCSAVENLGLGPDTTYPQPGVILCTVVGRYHDVAEQDVIAIELYGVCSIDNENRFEVFPTALVEGEFNSIQRRPWNGQAEPNALLGGARESGTS
jgi:hypothetical protein